MKNIHYDIAIYLILSIVLISAGCKSKDPAPEPASPTISITVPSNFVEFRTSESISFSGVLTSGSNLNTLTATIIYKTSLIPISAELRPQILKSLPLSPWTPQPVVVTLNQTLNQTLTDQILFDGINANAASGNYLLTLVAADVAGKTATKEILFKIL